MQLKTHLAVGLALALYFLPHIKNKTIFFFVVIGATLLPNVLSYISFKGNFNKKSFFSLSKKEGVARDILHTYTVCVAVSIFLALFYPIFAFPFFLGYSFHLLLDSFTPDGITPFWPYKKKSVGKVKVGGRIENVIFYIVCIFCVALIINLVL